MILMGAVAMETTLEIYQFRTFDTSRTLKIED